MRIQTMFATIAAEREPSLRDDPEAQFYLDPSADLDQAHGRLIEAADGTRRWFLTARAEDRPGIAYDLERQLVVDGMDVDREALLRFLEGEDDARVLSFPPTGADDLVGGPWRDRYWIEERSWEERRVLGRRQRRLTIACLQAAVPALLADSERAGLEDFRTMPYVFYSTEFALRRGTLFTLAFPVGEGNRDEYASCCEAAFAAFEAPPELAPPIAADGHELADLSSLVTPSEIQTARQRSV